MLGGGERGWGGDGFSVTCMPLLPYEDIGLLRASGS